MPDEKSGDRGWVSREEYDRMELLHKNNLWAYVHAYARACDFIGRNFGDEALFRFHVESGEESAHPRLRLAAEMGPEKLMPLLCEHMNNIGGDFTLEETDEAIVVRGTCGTGGRYVREAGTARNREGVPYYCVHCPIWWQEMPKQFGIKLSFEMGDQGVGCAWRLEK
jgi:hypothetical protein